MRGEDKLKAWPDAYRMEVGLFQRRDTSKGNYESKNSGPGRAGNLELVIFTR
jgi:hypothetical protein